VGCNLRFLAWPVCCSRLGSFANWAARASQTL